MCENYCCGENSCGNDVKPSKLDSFKWRVKVFWWKLKDLPYRIKEKYNKKSYLVSWAEKEVAAACRFENPDWDGKSFDYGCNCYQSALKGYTALMKSIENDGHSGFSWGLTKMILKKLIDQKPLTPIVDDDFFETDKDGNKKLIVNSVACDDYISAQCPRRSSLFREEYNDGTVKYLDTKRVICTDAEQPDMTYSCGLSQIIDKRFPITMPYMPEDKPYILYNQQFLTDKKHGDFDVVGVLKITKPDGTILENFEPIYLADEGCLELLGMEVPEKNNDTYLWNMVIIDQDTYNKLEKKRIDPLYKKLSLNIFDEIFDWPSKNDMVIGQDEILEKLDSLTPVFEFPVMWEYNTSKNLHDLSRGELSDDIRKINPDIDRLNEYCKQLYKDKDKLLLRYQPMKENEANS